MHKIFLMCGGAHSAPPPIFICENNRKYNKIMHCVDFFLSGSFEDRTTFHVIQLSNDGGGPYVPITIDRFVKNVHNMALSSHPPLKNFFFFNTVHNLITFSIVFTNKNGGGTLSAPSS